MRLLTRSDFDGLVCAVLLVQNKIVDEYKFVHPKDIQDGKVEATANDVLANIPYIPGCGIWFDHHSSEGKRQNLDKLEYEGISKRANSTAQLIFDYYGGEKSFGTHFNPLLTAVNKSDSGQLTHDEILNPKNWILLSFVMDPRTGLGRFQDYRISNYQLMEEMIQHCRTKTAEEIMELPDILERTRRYFKQQELFKEMLLKNTTIVDHIIITNLLDADPIYSGNRFMIYALYPDQNIEIRVMWGKEKKNVVFACGHSILNRTSNTDVGKLMLKHGGGGHRKVGTCQVPTEQWEQTLEALIKSMKKDG